MGGTCENVAEINESHTGQELWAPGEGDRQQEPLGESGLPGLGRRAGIQMGVGADTESVQMPDRLGVLVPVADPRQLRRVAPVEASELAQLVEGQLGDAEPLARVEQRLEAGQVGASVLQRAVEQ